VTNRADPVVDGELVLAADELGAAILLNPELAQVVPDILLLVLVECRVIEVHVVVELRDAVPRAVEVPLHVEREELLIFHDLVDVQLPDLVLHQGLRRQVEQESDRKLN